MNFDKSKNIIVFFLVILNISLFILNYEQDNKHRLNDDKKQAIVSVYANHDISIKGELVDYGDMKYQLFLKETKFENIVPVGVFFDNDIPISRTVEFEQTIFSQNGKEFKIRANKIEMNSSDKIPVIELSETTAIALTDEFLENTKLGFQKLEVFSSEIVQDGIEIRYYEKYESELIHCNYAYFTVNDFGIVKGELQRFDVDGFKGSYKHICSVDEALIAVLPSLTLDALNKSVERIEFAYDISEETSLGKKNLIANPYYLIYISGSDVAIKVEAYTNQVM